MTESTESIEQGLDCYDPEARVFPNIRQKAAKAEPLSKRDILLMLRWKLGRITDAHAQTIADDKMTEINEAVVNAGKPDRKIEALEALERIPGVGLAVATVILTVCYPDDFTIIDWRVLEALDLFPDGLPEEKRREYNSIDWTAKTYLEEYLPKVRERQKLWGCTLRETDRALWGLSLNRRVEKVIKKSEKC